VLGEVQPKPVALDGQVVVRPVLPLMATIDHRYTDGWHISQLIKPFKAYVADPQAYEHPLAAGASPDGQWGVEDPASSELPAV